MFSTGRKSLNYGDLHSGETLFDFLKRKKKYALEESFKKSHGKSMIDYTSYDEQTKRNRGMANNTKKQNVSSNVLTPKKVSFGEGEEKKSCTRTFVDMISPLKRRNIIEKERTPQQQNKSQPKQHKSVQELYVRKNLNNSFNIVKSTLQKFIESGRGLKDKAHSLFLELRPILKHVEEGENRNFARRAEDAKVKLKTFEHMFKEFNVENGNEMIQKFHQNLSEHITSLEANIRSEYEKDQMGAFRKIKQQKDATIEDLHFRNAQLEKQLDITCRRLEKSQKLVQKLKEQNEHQMDDNSRLLEEKVRKYEEKLNQLQKQNDQIVTELDQAKQERKKFEKLYKDALYTKEEVEKTLIHQNTKVKASKEQYLLNEIMILKKEFHNDMNQLSELYSKKEKENLLLIDDLRRQIQEMMCHRKTDKDLELKTLQEATTYKTQVNKYKKQNECLVTDMHRMNEELYQHWLALKDVKTLASRLHLLPKFIKIYEDLNFNDQLFN